MSLGTRHKHIIKAIKDGGCVFGVKCPRLDSCPFPHDQSDGGSPPAGAQSNAKSSSAATRTKAKRDAAAKQKELESGVHAIKTYLQALQLGVQTPATPAPPSASPSQPPAQAPSATQAASVKAALILTLQQALSKAVAMLE